MIELVIHCFAERLPVFAKMLSAQLASLYSFPPSVPVMVSVVTAPTDSLTISVLSSYSHQFHDKFHAGDRQTRIQAIVIPPAELFRRAIGRNILAKQTKADIVWFLDCDYLFCEGCLDALAKQKIDGLAYPDNYYVHRTHEIGDAEIATIPLCDPTWKPYRSLYERTKNRRAIGGLQIVDGDTARRGGYLDGTRWTVPLKNPTRFVDTKDDMVYRGSFASSRALSLPNLLRMRHTDSAFEKKEERIHGS
jgi:hypothetical protein